MIHTSSSCALLAKDSDERLLLLLPLVDEGDHLGTNLCILTKAINVKLANRPVSSVSFRENLRATRQMVLESTGQIPESSYDP